MAKFWSIAIGRFMKKIIILALIAVLVPQITLAAWWNPFSWFKKQPTSIQPQIVEQDIKTQALENRIKDLEQKINNQQTIATLVATTTVEDKVKPVVPATPPKPDLTKPAQPKTVSTPTPVPENFNLQLLTVIIQNRQSFVTVKNYLDSVVASVSDRIAALDRLIKGSEAAIDDSPTSSYFFTLSDGSTMTQNEIDGMFLKAYIDNRSYVQSTKNLYNSYLKSIDDMLHIIDNHSSKLPTLFVNREMLVTELKSLSDMNIRANGYYEKTRSDFAEFKKESDDRDQFYQDSWDKISGLVNTHRNKMDYVPPRPIYIPVVSAPTFTNCTVSSYGSSGYVNCLSF